MTNDTCSSCRYYLPNGETHYNKPCGYCAHSRKGTRRVSDDKACNLYELDEQACKRKPDR